MITNSTPNYRPAKPPAEKKPFISPQLVLHALRRWWMIVIPIGMVLGSAGAAGLWSRYEPVYKASAWLQIEEVSPYLAFQDRSDSRKFVANQVALMRSHIVLGSVVSNKDVSSTPELKNSVDIIAALGRNINVRAVSGSEMYSVEFQSTDPVKASLIVNEVAKSYYNLHNQTEAVKDKRVLDLLETEKNSRESGLKDLRGVVKTLAIETTGKDPYVVTSSSERAGTYSPVSELQSRLVSAKVEKLVLEVEHQALKEIHEKETFIVPETGLNQAVEQHPDVLTLRARIATNGSTALEYEKTAVNFKDNATYQKLQKQILADKEDLAKLKIDLKTIGKEDLEARYLASKEEELSHVEIRLNGLNISVTKIQEMLDKEMKLAKKTSGDTFELEIKQRELEELSDIHRMIESRILKIRTEQRAPSRVALLPEIPVPTVPIEKLPYKNMLMIFMVGLAAPFGLAVLKEALTVKVSGREQLELQSNTPVLAEISQLPKRRTMSPGNSTVSTSLRMYEESIDSLRTNIMLPNNSDDIKVIVVSSACSREGKTSVACQLAISLARSSGRKTLLIDGDMRSPDIHNVFEVPKSPGLAEVLNRDIPLKDAINREWSDSVHLLTAGTLMTSPHKLLGTNVFDKLMKGVRGRYRYVVLDTPPVLAASEALVMAKQADVSLVCAMRDVSRISQVQSVVERLESVGASPMGTVLNGVSASYYSYHYGHYGYNHA